MNFHDIRLESRILVAQPDSQDTSTDVTPLLIFLESDMRPEEVQQTLFAKGLYGSLKAKTVYPVDSTASSLFFILPSEKPRGLSGRKAGNAHEVSAWGAALAVALLGYPGVDKKCFKVIVSQKADSILRPHLNWFISALLQRSVTNKSAGQALRSKKTVSPLTLSFPDDWQNEKLFSKGVCLHEAMLLTRSLVNAPANLLNPETYEAIVRELAKEHCEKGGHPNTVSVEVYRTDRLKEEGCGLIEAVGKGSDIPPRIVKLSYQPKMHSAHPPQHLTLVGKGITYDTGGLNIKPSAAMRNMKKDMGGSASVLGTFFALVRQSIPAKVTCYIALAENMISGRSMRPGDIYRARNGLTVEIDNTDAEGRLVLADALCLAAEEKPDFLIDVATLTGAARVATGPMVDPFFTNDTGLERVVFDAGIEIGDWVWPLPLVDDYEPYFDAAGADMANSASTPFAGSITAALFLRRFIGETRWCHIDSFMWADKSFDLYGEPGGTAKCVRLLTHAMQELAARN